MPTDREIVIEIFNAALESVDPYKAVLNRAGDIAETYRAGRCEKLYLLSFGKAAFTMARAVMDSIGELVTGGIVITKYGHAGSLGGNTVRVFEAGHPIPDENGYRATREVLEFLNQSDEGTFVLCLISGGGSSLFMAPYSGISLQDKQKTTTLLLTAGADIYEMNTVRKHISLVKGGRLAAIACPSRVESLILSDVLGDRLDVIASGPMVPDGTTFGDALDVVEKYRVVHDIPIRVLELLRSGARGVVPETPKPGDAVFRMVSSSIVGNNAKAVLAAKDKAMQLGFEVRVIDTAVYGEARDVGVRLAREALMTKTSRHGRDSRPGCLISGGETTVTVRGHGIGGRNMELALAFAIEIRGQSGITLLSAGTDGGDGPTDAAGAIVDGQSVAKGLAADIDAEKYLQNNDSYSYFAKTNELLITGPTGTNVMDIQVVLLNA
jgi:glycerate 2-kinase